jgi:hypothetical protein
VELRLPDLVTRAKSELFLILALLGSTALISIILIVLIIRQRAWRGLWRGVLKAQRVQRG